MASNIHQFLFIFTFIFLDFVNICSCQLFNRSIDQVGGSAVATWYTGAGPAGSGGACGLEDDVAKAPYNGMITAGNQALFRQGFGCGACYQVSCSHNPQCSGRPTIVTVTDLCPDKCNNDPIHFDLSRIAFGDMAKPGQAESLIKVGRINISYKRVACNYRQNIIFKVDKGSNPNFFAVAIEAENGDGALSLVEIRRAGSNTWVPMKQLFGATWSANINPVTQKPPFSLKLTSEFKHSVIANNVIPLGWKPREIYKSDVNFPPRL